MQVYEVAVLGKPITQGSMRKSRGGHIVHDKADQLHAWRQAIEDAFYEKYGTDGTWVPIDKAVRVEVIITVPRTHSMTPGVPEFADTRPDVDKLARAIGDALSPGPSGKVKTGPRAGQKHFRMLSEDGRIVSWEHRRPTPGGTTRTAQRSLSLVHRSGSWCCRGFPERICGPGATTLRHHGVY